MSNIVSITTVDFYGDTLIAAERPDGVYVAVSPICKALGVNADRQRDRIQRDTILAEGATMMGVPSTGGVQQTLCLPLHLVPGFLFGIDDGRIKDATTAEKVRTYKRECHRVLAEHFLGGSLAAQHGKSPTMVEPVETRRRLVSECRNTFDRLAARELWFELGLPVVPSMVRPEQGELFHYTAERRTA